MASPSRSGLRLGGPSVSMMGWARPRKKSAISEAESHTLIDVIVLSCDRQAKEATSADGGSVRSRSRQVHSPHSAYGRVTRSTNTRAGQRRKASSDVPDRGPRTPHAISAIWCWILLCRRSGGRGARFGHHALVVRPASGTLMLGACPILAVVAQAWSTRST
jgi:hypothetical protein